MLTSLCVNNKTHVDAYLLECELTTEDIDSMKSSMDKFDITIHDLKVDRKKFDDRLPRDEWWTIEAYFRLMLFDLLPVSVERVLYLDVDIIVNKSINDMYNLPFMDYEMYGCVNSCGLDTELDHSPKVVSMMQEAFSSGYKYINSGVLLLNVARLREKYNFDYYCKVMKEWDFQMEAPDQDIINYVHWKKIGYMEWAFYDIFAGMAHTHGITKEEIEKNCSIIHYAGDKPWKFAYFRCSNEEIWWKYAKMTDRYVKLSEEFIISTLEDETIKTTFEALKNENNSLREKLTEFSSKMEALEKSLCKI